jgi:hypothetical protein
MATHGIRLNEFVVRRFRIGESNAMSTGCASRGHTWRGSGAPGSRRSRTAAVCAPTSSASARSVRDEILALPAGEVRVETSRP